jgi:hypothetical protein
MCHLARVVQQMPLSCADCHHLQEQFLQQIFKHALHCARQFAAEATSAAPGSPAAAASGAAAAAAMKLMTAVLAWDFKATNSSLGFMSASLAGLTAAMVRPCTSICTSTGYALAAVHHGSAGVGVQVLSSA